MQLKDKKIRPQFPRDGEEDIFPGAVEFIEDSENDGKFLIKSTRRQLSLWESQLDQLAVLIGDKKGATKIVWKKGENSKYVFPSFPDEA